MARLDERQLLEIGERITDARRAIGLTQAALAEHLVHAGAQVILAELEDINGYAKKYHHRENPGAVVDQPAEQNQGRLMDQDQPPSCRAGSIIPDRRAAPGGQGEEGIIAEGTALVDPG